MSAARHPTHERRPEIADAALRLIATRGIASLTMATLAAELGITAGALFRHFESREAILAATAARASELLDATFPPSDAPPIERIERFVRARAHMAGVHAGVPRLVLSEQFALALPSEATATIRRSVERTRAFMVKALRDGQRSGEVRDDVPAEALAAIAIGAMQASALAHARLPIAATKPEPVLQALLTVIAPPARDRRARKKERA